MRFGGQNILWFWDEYENGEKNLGVPKKSLGGMVTLSLDKPWYFDGNIVHPEVSEEQQNIALLALKVLDQSEICPNCNTEFFPQDWPCSACGYALHPDYSGEVEKILKTLKNTSHQSEKNTPDKKQKVSYFTGKKEQFQIGKFFESQDINAPQDVFFYHAFARIQEKSADLSFEYQWEKYVISLTFKMEPLNNYIDAKEEKISIISDFKVVRVVKYGKIKREIRTHISKQFQYFIKSEILMNRKYNHHIPTY